MTNATLNQIVATLQQQHARRPGADRDQLVHNVLAAYALTPTEHFGIVDAFRRRERADAQRFVNRCA